MTALQASIGLAQLENYQSNLQRKRELGLFYTGALKSLGHVQLPPARSGTAENVYWVFGLVLEDHVPMDAVEVMRRLRLQGIETRPFFWPLHEQPVLRARGLFNGERLPVSERLARRGFYLPSGLGLSQEQRVRVVDALHRVLK
jgi:perosamine synthetase